MTRIIVVLAFAVLVASCGPKISGKTGDETRSAATEVQPGTTVDDKVSYGDDDVDWKRFDVPQRTLVTVNVYWDNPSVKAEVALRDMFGGAVASVTHAEGAGKDTLSVPGLREGTYFLEIRALGGSSVYTVEVVLGSDTGSYGVPRPE